MPQADVKNDRTDHRTGSSCGAGAAESVAGASATLNQLMVAALKEANKILKKWRIALSERDGIQLVCWRTSPPNACCRKLPCDGKAFLQ